MSQAVRVVDRVADMADWDQTGFADGYHVRWNASLSKFVAIPPPVPAGGATGAVLQKNTAGDYDASWAPLPPLVTGFNTRTGAVTLGASDVTTALGYTPLQNAPVTSVFGRTGAVVLTSADVTGALGFTPLQNAPVTSVFGRTGTVVLTSTDVTGALGFTDFTRTGVANTFTTGTQTISTGGISITGLVVRGIAGQTSNIQEWQNYSGTPVASVDPSGGLTATSVTVGSLGGVIRAAAGLLSGGASTSDLPEGANLYYTSGRASAAAPVQSVFGRTGAVVLTAADVTGALGFSDFARLGQANTFTAATTVPTLTVGTLGGVLKATTGSVAGGATTTDLPEGTNLYYTNARAAAAAPVQSVFGRTGAVVLTAADVTGALGYTDIARTGVANTFTVGGQIIQTGAATTKGLVLKGAPSQSANILEVQDGSGNVLALIGPTGSFSSPNPTGGTGGGNERFGVGALIANTTGNFNAAFGGNSLRLCTTGVQNAAFGYNALGACTTGNDNMAIGYFALASCTSGTNNTAIGPNAGYALSIGSQNVAIGSGAGNSTMTSGNYNVLLGGACDTATGGTSMGVALGYAGICQSNELAISRVINFQTGYGYTNQTRPRSDITDSWVDATDATRKARRVFNIWDTAAREAMRLEAAGGTAAVSFFGVTAVGRQGAPGNIHTLVAGATTNVFTNTTFDGSIGTTGYTVGDIVLALKNYGLLAA